MEQRKSSMFFPLLKNSLESKKNWFFLSALVIFVSTLLDLISMTDFSLDLGYLRCLCLSS